MQEMVPVYNVQCDVGNTKALADLFMWLNRPGVPFDERSMMIDDILEQLSRKHHAMPTRALHAIQDFLGEMESKMSEIISDIMARETKLSPEIMEELSRKQAAVKNMMSILAMQVGAAKPGSCTLTGGVPLPAYTLPEHWEVEKDGFDGTYMQETVGQRRRGW